ncbi:MAG: histidine kinase dimerization/phospho-acceptor domain-containing protein [bacterium]
MQEGTEDSIFQKKMITKRKTQIKLILLFSLLLFLGVNSATFLFYLKAKDYLDQELGERLKAIAATSSLKIDSSLLSSSETAETLYPLLAKIKEANQLEALFIFDRNRRSLVDTRPEIFFGQEYPYLALHPESVDKAWSGTVSSSELYQVEGLYFKSGYAPIGEEAILCVEASAQFLGVLDRLKRSLMAGSLLASLGVGLLVLLLIKAISSLASSEAFLLQAERVAAMGQMAGSVAHQIRNPLSIIRGTAEALKERYDPESQDELFDYITEEVKRID